MFVLGNLIYALAEVIGMILQLYMIVIIARAVLSWVNPDPYNPIVQFLYRSTEPVLYRVRRWMPFNTGGIDLSPIIVLVAISFLQNVLVMTLKRIAMQLQ